MCLKSADLAAVASSVGNIRPALLVGVADARWVEHIRASVRDAGFELESVPTALEALSYLDEVVPSAILIDVAHQEAEMACLRIRGQTRLAAVPIIGLVSELTDLAFPEMYGWGGDDLARMQTPRDLVRLLRALSVDKKFEPPKPRGLAIVADLDRRRRTTVARVLHNAGFDVHFALTSSDVEAVTQAGSVSLVVADLGLEPDGAIATITRIRATGVIVPCVLTAEPKRIPGAIRAIRALAPAAITDTFAPPENVLFVANELSRSINTDGRSSPRVLYGSLVTFRLAGRDEDSFGFTYNVSGGGMYVRTLASPQRGEDVWLELRPPRSDRRVRLEAKVAWARPFGPNEGATVPAGFGVRITDATRGDMDRYVAGYDAFCNDVLGHLSMRPNGT